jgi:sarcosine oxidase, subunit beta
MIARVRVVRGPRVVVIGAGAAGLATAAALGRLAARSVVVVEAGSVAAGSSGRSAGVFNRQTPHRVEQTLRCATVDVLSEMQAHGELHLERTGYVRVAGDAAQVDQLRDAQARGVTLGVTDARLINPAELAQLVPGMRVDDLAGGLYCPSDGHLDGHLLCAAFLARAEAGGATLQTNERVEQIAFTPNGVRVTTQRSVVDCDVVVNAAGAWAPRVAALACLELSLVNQRHEIVIVHLPHAMNPPVPMVNTYMPGAAREGLYFRSEGDRRLVAGSHAHEILAGHAVDDPDRYQRQVGFDFLERIAGALAHRLPGWRDLRLEPGWAGLYPTSPDGLPQIGPYRQQPRFVAAAGLNGTGLTMSAAVGQLAAEWAVFGEGRAFAFADQLLPDRKALTTTHP